MHMCVFEDTHIVNITIIHDGSIWKLPETPTHINLTPNQFYMSGESSEYLGSNIS